MPTRKNTTTTNKAPAARRKKVVKKKTAPKKTAARRSPRKTAASKQPSVQTLTLDNVTVINNAQSLYQALCQFDKNNDVNIDASAVEMIDTAVLQLLYAFVIKIQSSDRKVHWTSPSDEFVSRASLLGLSQPMGIS